MAVRRAHRDGKPAAASESALLASAIAGDVDAFAEIVRRHQRVVFSVARTCGLGREDAADVTQVVFATLASGMHTIDDGARVRSWLCTVARRQAWRVNRRRDREDLGSPPDRATDDEVGRVDALVSLIDALDTLRPRCRDLLTALYLNEPPRDYQEVSAELGIAIGSIGPTRARCLEQLRVVVEGHGRG